MSKTKMLALAGPPGMESQDEVGVVGSRESGVGSRESGVGSRESRGSHEAAATVARNNYSTRCKSRGCVHAYDTSRPLHVRKLSTDHGA